MIFKIVRVFPERKILFAVPTSIHETPDHLRYKMRGLPALVKGRVHLVNANGSKLIAHSCVTHELANFVTVKTVSRGIAAAGRITAPNTGNIHAYHIGIAHY